MMKPAKVKSDKDSTGLKKTKKKKYRGKKAKKSANPARLPSKETISSNWEQLKKELAQSEPPKKPKSTTAVVSD